VGTQRWRSEKMSNGCEFSSPTVYEIRVKGALDPIWSDWFTSFSVLPQPDGETLLIGLVADQPALHGLLAKIRDLGLPLLCVRRVKN
jgi:hypothetical protein